MDASSPVKTFNSNFFYDVSRHVTFLLSLNNLFCNYFAAKFMVPVPVPRRKFVYWNFSLTNFSAEASKTQESRKCSCFSFLYYCFRKLVQPNRTFLQRIKLLESERWNMICVRFHSNYLGNTHPYTLQSIVLD